MNILRNINIDFMKYRRIFATVSAILIAVGIFSVFVHGELNIGVDFAGGTQLTIRFAEQPKVDELRALLADAGIPDVQIQRFGEEGDNEVLVRTPIIEGSEEGSRDLVVQALDARYNAGATGGLDLNQAGTDQIASYLFAADPQRLVASQGEDQARATYTAIAEAVSEVKNEDGLIESYDELAAGEGIGPQVVQSLRDGTNLGSYSILGVENVGPQIGRELRRKGQLAVILSMIGMLIYIWVRFELHFGIGALVAVLHDVLITVGVFALLNFEFNLTTIAAFLTVVGYSVNDSVVIFDRVRENSRKNRRMPLVDVMNESLNQTLSRTILTSSTTFLAVSCLFFLGGDVISGFAFVVMVGVVIGTYSSIFVACPFALLWEQLNARRKQAKAGGKGRSKKAVRRRA